MQVIPWYVTSTIPQTNREFVKVYSAYFSHKNESDFFPLLSAEETSQVSRLVPPEKSKQKVISRGILRQILSRYTGDNPQRIKINSGKNGKPFLERRYNPLNISFNVAHSGDIALFAVSNFDSIGIDIEKLDTGKDLDSIAAIMFSMKEREFLKNSTEKNDVFHQIWTLKEAILKCYGYGFAYPSSEFSVVLNEGAEQIYTPPDDLSKGRNCTIMSFTPGEGYIAAISILKKDNF
jgi:4'-phosphopantetheinyl transferase